MKCQHRYRLAPVTVQDDGKSLTVTHSSSHQRTHHNLPTVVLAHDYQPQVSPLEGPRHSIAEHDALTRGTAVVAGAHLRTNAEKDADKQEGNLINSPTPIHQRRSNKLDRHSPPSLCCTATRSSRPLSADRRRDSHTRALVDANVTTNEKGSPRTHWGNGRN